MRKIKRRRSPYADWHGYPIRTHKRDVYWRIKAVLGWSSAEWWKKLARRWADLADLEKIVGDAEQGHQIAIRALRGMFEE